MSRGRSALVVMMVLAALLAALAAAGQESKPTVRHHRVEETVPDTSSEIEQAEAAMQRNNFAAAEALLQKAGTNHPDDYRAWFDLGYVYSATQRATQAVDAYRKAVAAKPDVFESNLNLGLLLAKQGENIEAAKYLSAATRLKPTQNAEQNLARAWLALGRVTAATEPQQALAAFTEAGKLAPQDLEAHLATAALLQQQNKPSAAEQEFQTAYRLDPQSQAALTGLTSVYIAEQKYPEAEGLLRRVIAANPQNTDARVQLARLLAEEDKNDEAAQQLQQAQQAAGAVDGQTALELGTLYVKAGTYPEAEQQLRFTVQKMPQNPEAHFALGSLLMHLKKYPEAQSELLEAVKLKPDLAEAYGNLAVVTAENKDYQLAIQALDSRTKYLPETPATYFLRATSFDNLKAVPQAVDYYRRFLAADAGRLPDQEWQARHRLIALDPRNADKYEMKSKK